MTAGTSNGLAMIRRAIARPRSSIVLEEPRKRSIRLLFAEHVPLVKFALEIALRSGPASYSSGPLPSAELISLRRVRSDPSQRVPVSLNLLTHGRVGKASPPGTLIVDQMSHLGGAGNRDGDGRMGDHVL
jgi:hypothetical protein